MSTTNIHKPIILTLVGLLSILFSCEKTQEENLVGEEAVLSVNIEGLAYEAENDILASNKASEYQTSSDTHIQYVNEDFRIESQLVPIENNRTENLKTDFKQSASAVLQKLADNIKYKLLVYDAAGNFVDERDYIYKQETLESAIPLNTYTEYIFVVVSSRSTSNIPQITNHNNLSSAQIKNVNADLLYWKSKKMKLNKGKNFLAAKLKPKFSEVTTTLQMHNTMTGQITAIHTPTFNSLVQDVTLNLKDGKITYESLLNNGKSVTFPSLGTGKRSITSNTTILIPDTTTNMSLTFNALEVDNEIKNNITVAGLNFKPGHRYNLILTLRTCTQAVSGNGFDWEFPQTSKTFRENGKNVTYTGIDFKPQNSTTTTFVKNGDIITFNFTEEGADYGFVYNITELDNAFNLEVNGTPITGTSVTTGEVQFQNNATNTTQNIEFEDGSQYQSIGNNNITANKRVKAIWEFKGTVEKPVIRVVIGRNGDVRLYGSKTDQGELFPLRLKNGMQFNTITWNGGDLTNTIIATSRVEGKTVMDAYGSGVKKISCTK